MIVADKKFSVSGNTALVPERKTYENSEEEKYKKIRESQREALRRKKHLKLKSQARIIMSIVIIFIMGITIIYRYSEIYTMQGKLLNLQNEERNITSQNENLKYKLSSYDDIKEIQKNATEKLHMIQPNDSNVVHVNLSKNSITVKKDGNTNNKSKNIFEVIMSKLFLWR